MTIEKRGDKYRIRQMVDGKRYSVLLDYKPSKREAESLINEKINEESKNLPKLGTFEDYAEKYISAKENVLKSPTRVKYRSMLKNMSEQFKNLQLRDINQEDVQILINEYSVSHSPKSTKDLHGFVASIIGFYRPNLQLRTTLPQAVKKMEYEPTDEDIKAILKRAEGTRYDIIFNLLVYGLRRSEALAVNVETDLFDRKENTTTLLINKALVIDENGEFYVRESNKTTESTRCIEIANALADKMLEAGCVFDGKPHMINKALTRYQEQLGIPHFKLHAFRSYYASMMLSLGVPITYVETTGGWRHGSQALRKAYTYTQAQKLKEEQSKGVEFISKLKD